jgi:hypothetical protein
MHGCSRKRSDASGRAPTPQDARQDRRGRGCHGRHRRVWTPSHIAALLGTPAALLLLACSGTLARLGTVEHTIGRASAHDIMTEVPAVLRRHGYAIYEAREDGSNLYIETGWQDRAPFDDEAEQGVDYARTRFIARARMSAPGIYELRISAENQVRPGRNASSNIKVREGLNWGTMLPTKDFKTFVDDVTGEIEMRVAAGLRVY